jgi:hypothetical protein
VEAARVVVVFAAETSAQEAAAARDTVILCVNHAEDWAALVEREAQKRVSKMGAENVAVLACAREEAGGLV